MSSQSVVLNTGNQAIINTDVSKIFLRDNRYQKGNNLNNSGYDPLNLVAGTLMGRVTATGNLTYFNAAASDGSQAPVGILADDVAIDSGDTEEVTIVDFGDVAADKVVFVVTGQGLETAVTIGVSRRVKDHLQAQGIKLIVTREQTHTDNQ
jgi:hypothetical protein